MRRNAGAQGGSTLTIVDMDMIPYGLTVADQRNAAAFESRPNDSRNLPRVRVGEPGVEYSAARGAVNRWWGHKCRPNVTYDKDVTSISPT